MPLIASPDAQRIRDKCAENGNGFISQKVNRDERIPVLRIRRYRRATEPEAGGGTARALVDLADAYALCAARADFDQKLVQFMAQHGKRGALVRRLADAGLWKKSSR
ncbi:MAG: hypothetical protein Q7T46_09130 [Polaromonas sp.]|nr:hypothetical protein [Polaromonas sp.]